MVLSLDAVMTASLPHWDQISKAVDARLLNMDAAWTEAWQEVKTCSDVSISQESIVINPPRLGPAPTTLTNGSMTWSTEAAAGSGLGDVTPGTIILTRRQTVMRSVSVHGDLPCVSCRLFQVHAKETTTNGTTMLPLKPVGRYELLLILW